MNDRTYRASTKVAAKDVAGEMVLLELEKGEFFVAKGLGPKIYELLTKGQSIGEITKTVAERYDKDFTEVEGDITTFVEGLLSRELLEEVPPKDR